MDQEKYKNRYRIQSARANWWDYRNDGAYFITICTKDRAHFFGEIRKDRLEHSPCGVLADICWKQIPFHAPSARLGAFVVMPNHIHGILILKNHPPDMAHSGVDRRDVGHSDMAYSDIDRRDVACNVSTSNVSTETPDNTLYSEISPKAKSVSAIIRSYKSAVTFHANRLKLEHGWQERFHDHIIRNEAEYHRIHDYIQGNPITWESDRFYSEL